MSTQPTAGMGGMLPGVAAAGGLSQSDDDENRTTDDGVAVGEADREADVERSGADDGDHDVLAPPDTGLTPDAVGTAGGSDDGTPVGAADADADRRRTEAD
jgi:hypothetical protein